MTKPDTIFEAGKNCWRIERANHASLVVDCANYYRNLYESMMKAKHSIFITGWDIDSRVELLRGNFVKDPDGPKNLHELLTFKAQENPDLKIYLNRWDYALMMAQSREPMGVFKWRGTLLENIYFCRDDMVPFGACHHQKVIVIDDETAYMGGMDIALLRWDRREHFPQEEHRVDPGGAYDPHGHTEYGPYHDIMTVVSGPAARAYAELSRERWKLATGYDPLPLRENTSDELPPTWPDSDGVDFSGIDVAIARTLPPMENVSKEFYIEQMYLDEIARAEKFIYMENQYFTRDSIARALNLRMVQKPDLQVVLVSSYDPQGLAERKAMWSGRIKFYNTLKKNGTASRVVMVYPASEVNGHKATVRIHSKFMIVDDKFLHIGSANLNNRSMRVDTEVDMVYASSTPAHAQKIADIRNDLIKEHTGREPEQTEAILAKRNSVREILQRAEGSRQFFEEVRDQQDFKDDSFIPLAIFMGDPEGAFLPDITILPRRHGDVRRFPLQKIIFFLIVAALVVGLVSLWKLTPLGDYITPDNVATILERLREAPGSIPMAIALYAIAMLVFIPCAPLTAGAAIAFGPVTGFLISVAGAMLGSFAGYMVGKIVKPEYFGIMMRTAIERVRQQAKDSSIAAITFLRMLPVAPFSVVNIALSIARVPLPVYMIGTLLGFLPGTAALVFMGDSLSRLWLKPDMTNYLMVGAGIALWVGFVLLSRFAYRCWKDSHGKAATA